MEKNNKLGVTLSGEAKNIAEHLANKYSISKAAVIAIALKKYYEEEEGHKAR